MRVEGNGKPVKFKIDMSGLITQQIKQLKNEAQIKGLGQDVNKALAIIFGRLRTNPLDFGELIGDFKHLQLIVHVGVVSPLFVRFAIHQEAHVVIIMGIQFLNS